MKIVQKTKALYEGYKNLIFRDADVEVWADKRAAICIKCKHFSSWGKPHCKVCKCFIAPKVRQFQEKCPKGLWK